MPQNAIDVQRAIELKRIGLTWREIGIELAKREGRELPYHGTSVQSVVLATQKVHQS